MNATVRNAIPMSAFSITETRITIVLHESCSEAEVEAVIKGAEQLGEVARVDRDGHTLTVIRSQQLALKRERERFLTHVPNALVKTAHLRIRRPLTELNAMPMAG